MAESNGQDSYLIKLPLWVVGDKSGNGIGVTDPQGRPVGLIFTEELFAERYIENCGHTDCVPVSIPEKDTLKVIESMKKAKILSVYVDAKGGKNQDAVDKALPIEKVLEAARRIAKQGDGS